MQNRFLVGVLALSGISSLLHAFDLLSTTSFLPYSYTIFFWAGLILMLANSSLFNEMQYNRFYQVLGVLLVVGSLFKVMHWPFAYEILIGSMVTGAIGYGFRFFSKPEKGLLDYLKVAWVVAEVLTHANFLLRSAEMSYYVRYSAGVLFLFMLAVFLYEGFTEGWLLGEGKYPDADQEG